MKPLAAAVPLVVNQRPSQPVSWTETARQWWLQGGVGGTARCCAVWIFMSKKLLNERNETFGKKSNSPLKDQEDDRGLHEAI